MPENLVNKLISSLSEPIEVKNEKYLLSTKSIKDSASHKLYADIQIESNKWIEMACNQACESVKSKGGSFGAVIVQIDDDSNEVLRYWKTNNQVTLNNDPTAHAEIMAIRSACKSLGVFDLGNIRKEDSFLKQEGKTSHCEIFSSCEPCPMCYSAIFWARIPALYFAANRYDASKPGIDFSDKELYDELSIDYRNRKTQVFQCLAKNSLEAFKVWESSDKIDY